MTPAACRPSGGKSTPATARSIPGWMRRPLTSTALMVALALGGCGGDDGQRAGSTTSPPPDVTAPPGAPTSPSDVSAPPPAGSSPAPLPPPKTKSKPERVLGHSYSGRRPLEPPLEPTRECERVHVTYPDGDQGYELGPPIPAIGAKRVGDRVHVSYRFLAAPSECEPELIQSQVIPLGDPRQAPSVKRARVTELRGVIQVPLPRGGPPYGANLLTYSEPGSGSVTETRVR